MTNEQAAECLKTIHVLSFKDETATFFLTDVQNAFKLAIKALEQQPCDDCISRADILDAIETWDKFGINAEQKLIRWQDHYVPYVHLDDVRHAVANMPSVTPKGVTITDFADRCRECGKQKVGKWIGELWGYSCSQCKGCIDEDVKHLKYRYCPKCGAEMEMENEKETC